MDPNDTRCVNQKPRSGGLLIRCENTATDRCPDCNGGLCHYCYSWSFLGPHRCITAAFNPADGPLLGEAPPMVRLKHEGRPTLCIHGALIADGCPVCAKGI